MPPPGVSVFSGGLGWVVMFACLVVYAVAFAVNLRQGPQAPSFHRWGLLSIQLLVGIAMISDLLYLTAAQVAFVLPGRRALVWMGVQVGVAIPYLATEVWLAPGLDLGELPLTGLLAAVAANELGWNAFAFAAGWAMATQQTQREQLWRLNAELEEAQFMLRERTRLAERLAISWELHDSLGHELAALNVNLDLAERLSAGAPCEAAVRDARGVARGLLLRVREVVGTLRQPTPVELSAVLEALATSTPGVNVQVRCERVRVSSEQAHVLFRCAQEALTNVVMHAGANAACVELVRAEGGVRLEVRDDGGCRQPVRFGNGLTGMQERLLVVVGRLRVEPGDDGLRLEAWIPERT